MNWRSTVVDDGDDDGDRGGGGRDEGCSESGVVDLQHVESSLN